MPGRLTAYHEAGHAVVIHELDSQDPVHQITIVPRGQAGGMTISLPREDRAYLSKRELEERIAVCLGGRVAEQLVLNDISTGCLQRHPEGVSDCLGYGHQVRHERAAGDHRLRQRER